MIPYAGWHGSQNCVSSVEVSKTVEDGFGGVATKLARAPPPPQPRKQGQHRNRKAKSPALEGPEPEFSLKFQRSRPTTSRALVPSVYSRRLGCRILHDEYQQVCPGWDDSWDPFHQRQTPSYVLAVLPRTNFISTLSMAQ
jgi:hypothetical protein